MSNLHDKLWKNGSADPNLVSALARLNKALELLDHAVDESLETRNKVSSPSEEVQRMAQDRATMARALDEAKERTDRLTETNKEVSRKLVAAMESVRSVLENKA